VILNLFDLIVNELYEWILLYSNTHEKKKASQRKKMQIRGGIRQR